MKKADRVDCACVGQCHQGGLDPPGLGNPGQRGGTEGNCLGTTTPSVRPHSLWARISARCVLLTTCAPRQDCPYNLYRTSGDINAAFKSVMGNVNTVVKFLGGGNGQVPLSRPGAWAYPGKSAESLLASHGYGGALHDS